MPYGVSEEMIAAWGPAIFELSLNYQVRRGDSVRLLDFAAHAAGGDGSGRSDGEIAGRLGLTEEQVRFIRCVLERRGYRGDDYRKIFRLGGARRWRAEQVDDAERRLALAPGAPKLNFHPQVAAAALGQGQWRGDSAAALLARRAAADAPALALEGAATRENWAALARRCRSLAQALRRRGIGRGHIVVLQVDSVAQLAAGHVALAMLGAVTLAIAPDAAGADVMARAGASALLRSEDLLAPEGDEPLPELAAAAEPTLLLGAGPWALHSAQTIAANASAVIDFFGIEAGDRIAVRHRLDDPRALLAVWLALLSGAALTDSEPSVVLGEVRGGETPRLVVSDRPDTGRCWGSAAAPALCLARAAADLRPAAAVRLRSVDGRLQARGALLCGGFLPSGAGVEDGWIDTGLGAALAGDSVEPL